MDTIEAVFAWRQRKIDSEENSLVQPHHSQTEYQLGVEMERERSSNRDSTMERDSSIAVIWFLLPPLLFFILVAVLFKDWFTHAHISMRSTIAAERFDLLGFSALLLSFGMLYFTRIEGRAPAVWTEPFRYRSGRFTCLALIVGGFLYWSSSRETSQAFYFQPGKTHLLCGEFGHQEGHERDISKVGGVVVYSLHGWRGEGQEILCSECLQHEQEKMSDQ